VLLYDILLDILPVTIDILYLDTLYYNDPLNAIYLFDSQYFIVTCYKRVRCSPF
jgi:hypothetical protein